MTMTMKKKENYKKLQYKSNKLLMKYVKKLKKDYLLPNPLPSPLIKMVAHISHNNKVN